MLQMLFQILSLLLLTHIKINHLKDRSNVFNRDKKISIHINHLFVNITFYSNS